MTLHLADAFIQCDLQQRNYKQASNIAKLQSAFHPVLGERIIHVSAAMTQFKCDLES